MSNSDVCENSPEAVQHQEQCPREDNSGGLNRFLEVLVSVSLLVLASPLFIVLPLLIKLQDGGPAFYRGGRLGRGKEVFEMYKFRTLVPDAESRIGGQLLNHQHQLHTPLGRFLRDVRIDELPQLFNILRGDMAFFGPRPERPAVYETQCAHIPGYDKRFEVKPGMLGYSQLFTPHSAPKRLRASIDNSYSKGQQGMLGDMGVVFYALTRMSLDALKRTGGSLWKRGVLFGQTGKPQERRQLKRRRPKGVALEIVPCGGSEAKEPSRAKLLDINEEYMRLEADRPLSDGDLRIRLSVSLSGSLVNGAASDKLKTAHCRARVSRCLASGAKKHVYVVTYEPVSPLNRYLLDKYVIGKSIL